MLVQTVGEHPHMLLMGLHVLLTSLTDRLILSLRSNRAAQFDLHAFIRNTIGDILQLFTGQSLHLLVIVHQKPLLHKNEHKYYVPYTAHYVKDLNRKQDFRE